MKRMINMTNSPDDLSRFQDQQDLKNFCRKFGCDGLEYLRLQETENHSHQPRYDLRYSYAIL